MPSIRRVRTVFTGVAGTPWYSNLYFGAASGVAQDSIDAVAAFWTTLAAQINTAVTGTVEAEVPIIDVVSGEITSTETGVSASINFSGATAVLPPSSQGMLNLNTGVFVGGRQLRGKLYIPGLVVGAANSDGSVASAYSGAWQSVAATMIANTDTEGAWCVWSRTHGVFADVTGTSAMSQFAVLRSRRD